MRLDFKKLPLIEAAVRASLAEPMKLTYSLIYALRDKLPDFQELGEPQFFEGTPGFGDSFKLNPGELPGAWFSGHASGLSLSLQNQVIVVRWVRREGPTAEYPRYRELRRTLWDALDRLSSLVPCVRDSIAVVNMSYVNLLNLPHSAPVLRKYFAPAAHVALALDAKQVRKVEASWLEQDSIDLRFSLEQLTVIRDESVEAYRLTTAAGRRLELGGSPEIGLDGLHDRLQQFFNDLISPEAKNEWELNVADDN